ncbi:MAG: GDSL family lipase, partial [Alphaproteobacteria bacterium]|nr:GDSL family lipase [Alphaproteobacteria bacterium]
MKKEKLVCIGNSITNGFPLKRSQSFPALIREATGWEVINKGNNGETTEQVLERFPKDVLA